MASNKVSNAHVKITVDGQQAIAFYSQLQKRERELAASVKAGNKDSEKELNQVRGYLTDIKNEMQNIGDVVKGKVFANLATLERMAKQVKMQMKYAENIQDLRQLQTQYRVLTDRIREMTNQTQQSSHAFGRLAQRAAEYTGFYMLFNRSRQIITSAIQGNLKLSDSISDIQKVSGLSEEAVKGLVSQIEKIDSRNAPEVLNNMAYAAGKLGIKGAENLLGFTRAADKLNVALKEYLGDGAEGVVQLMKFANVMGTTDQYGVEQALLKTGSALNYMTQSTAAAADYMIDFAGRFGPIARQARMTSGDVIGLASALDALTVNNEEAATSLQKFVVKLLSSPTAVSKALGMDAQLSKQMVETGKSIELVEMALGKLGERAEKYGVSGISSVIGDIGSKGQAQRLIKTLATLSNNTEMVANYVTMANDAFNKGTSVIDEYNIKNQNAAAIMERAKNVWQKMLVNSSEVGTVKELAQAFYDLTASLQQNTVWMGSMKVALKGIVEFVGILLQALPSLIIYLASLGLSKLVLGIVNAARAMNVFVWSLKAGTTSWKAFSLAMKTNVFGLLLSIVPIAIDLITRFGDKTKDAKSRVDGLKDSIASLDTTVAATEHELKLYIDAIKKAGKGTEERTIAIKNFNDKFGGYLTNLITETSTVYDLADAYKEVARQIRNKSIEELEARDREKYVQPEYDRLSEMGQQYNQRVKGNKQFQQFNQAWLNAFVKDAADNLGDIWGQQGTEHTVARSLFKQMGLFGGNIEGETQFNLGKTTTTQGMAWGAMLTQKQVDDIIDAVDKGLSSFTRPVLKSQGMVNPSATWAPLWNGATTTGDAATEVEKMAFEALRYVRQAQRAFEADKDVFDTYASLKDNTTSKVDRSGGGGGTTETIEDFSKEEQERKRQEQEELEKAKQDISSIKSQLTAFYEWRESEIQKMRDQNEITEATKDLLVDANKAAHATSEMKAWEYLLGKDGAKEAWQAQLDVMRGEILKANPQMQALWDYLTKVNMEGLGSTLRRLGTQEIGGMEKTIATDADVVAKHAAKLAQAVQKELEKYDFMAQVRTKFVNGLTQLGLLKTKFSEGEYGGNSWEDEIAAANDAVDQIQSHYDELFDIDIDTNEGVEKFRDILYQCTALSTEIVEGSVDSIRLLYEKALEMGEEYTMALKRQTDKQKRIIDERWKRDMTNIEMQRTIKEQESLNKMTNSVMGRMGLQSNVATQDAEIQLYALRLQAATDYYNKLKAEKADQRLLDEQEQKMMEATVALTDKMASKITNMQQWFVDAMNTLPDYGTALGEAFAKSDPEERAEAFQEAHKEILKSLAETTKKMIIEWTKQRIQHAVNQQLMAQDTKKSGQEQFQAETTAQTAISNAMAAIGQQTLQTQQAQSQQSLATEASETQGKVALGIAGGAAKTIGELGWWGVPLVAVITAVLNGLLSWALGSLFKGKSSSTANTPKMKLVSGMLTYDEGNVSDVLTGRPPLTPPLWGGQGTKYLGTDGRTYKATPTPTPEGVAMVNHPIATMIGGMPALVGERGQEMIIGRRTLRDMTMFRPDLIQQIAAFERRRFRTYDEGNVGAMTGMTESRNYGGGQDMTQMLQTMEQMQVVLAALSKRLEHPIQATINKYGSGGLVDEVADGLYATKRRGTNANVRRLFG